MLRKFKISIDGTEYLVEMEELTPSVQFQPVQPPVQETTPVQNTNGVTQNGAVHNGAAQVNNGTAQVEAEPAPQPTEKGEGQEITAPMPGTVLKVHVNVGEQVKENQSLLVLEAMKMENEIVSPVDGVVTSIMVRDGQAVDVGEILITVQG